MKYKGTLMTDALSVTELYTVLQPELSPLLQGKGESHPFPEIIYLTEGSVVLLIDEKEYELHAGQMIIYAPNAYHDFGSSPSGTARAYILSFNAVSEILSLLYNRVISLTAKQKQTLSDIIDVGCESFCDRPKEETSAGMRPKERTETHTLWRLKKHLEFFLTDVYESISDSSYPDDRRDVSKDEEFRIAEAFIKAHFTEPLSVMEIASACSMSVSKLKSLFHEKTGGGPINYKTCLRIEEAKRMIDTSTMNFTEISDELGFISIHYFSRLFKKVTKMTPSQYAKRKNRASDI